MVKRIGFLFACLLIASPLAADPIVTWEATGEIGSVFGGASQSKPSVGTPVSLTMTFAPNQAVPTFGSSPGSGCMTVGLSASVNIGGYSWSGGGLGFTHAQLPGSTCGTSGLTQFSMHSMVAPPTDSPWDVSGTRIFVLSYVDLLVQDAFPDVPTSTFSRAHLFTVTSPESFWGLSAGLELRAVEQSAPIPEPGTMALLGVGLAAAVRSRKRK
jgi:hypothetical protein